MVGSTNSNSVTLPDDLYITDELLCRPEKSADYLQEKLALQDLASRMADHPAEVLPRFVDLAMQMGGGVSAGLSLYEEHPAPGIFRWTCLRGALSQFEGATTPRNFSPCGVTLDRDAPVLSRHPERVYDWISAANIVVPEVLLVPLHLGTKQPLGTLWIVSDKEGHFDAGHARVMTELGSFVGIALRMLESEQRLTAALERQETLAREMSHRVQNMLAVTDSMIRASANGAGSAAEMADRLSGRLKALGAAHSLVHRSFHQAGRSAGNTDLAVLVRTVLQPHDAVSETRFRIAGPAVRLGERTTNALALVVHELATNAVKYGALKSDSGTIDVTWEQPNGKLEFKWEESGGPPVQGPPERKGFGSRLSKATVGNQLDGTVVYDWRPEGLAVAISVPTENLST